jgi:hypothetical protein
MVIQALDSKPWFKQFWPWFLILLPASVVVAATVTLVIASTGADDLVAENYYKNGLAINRRLEKEQYAETLGISGSLQFSKTGVKASLVAPQLKEFPQSLSLKLSHPLEADRDFAVTLTPSSSSTYYAELPQQIGEHWHWTLEPPAPSRWELNGKIRAGDFTDDG